MNLSVELAEAVHRSADRGLPDAVLPSVIDTIVQTCSAAMSRSDRTLVAALANAAVEDDPRHPASDALTEAAAFAAAAHRASHPEHVDDGPCACPVVAAALTASRHRDVSGPAMLHAVACGTEVQVRLAAAMFPDGDTAGWRTTGVLGPIGAAVASSLVIGSTPVQLAQAIGIATSLTSGHGALGGSAEAIHAGKAASNGLLAAHLAHRDFSSSVSALEGPRGFFAVMGRAVDSAEVLAGLGDRWQSLEQPAPRAQPAVAALDAEAAALPAAPSVRPLLDLVRGVAA